MTIFTSTEPLVWGELDVPLFGLSEDWHGKPLKPMAGFSLALDQERLWFIANHRKPATVHPKSRPGVFQPDLWRYDVAELFLADPVSGRYLELNLAPNGAWWSCEFTAPRERASGENLPIPEVETYADMAPDGSWLAAMSLPLDLLQARIGFCAESRANVAMILGSPNQRFFSALDLGKGEPDFHQPALFREVDAVPLQDLPK